LADRALLLVHLGYSGVSISYHSHGAELTDDYNERTKVTVGREVFGLLGMTWPSCCRPGSPSSWATPTAI
jgi:Na+/melibiose symporter-like transporter